MTPSPPSSAKVIATNRKAFRDYFVLERLEAGIELVGTEVKSLREGQGSLTGGYALVDDGEVRLCDARIPPYSHGNQFNHDPDRPRRLLLHRKEINRLEGRLTQKGLTLVPLRLYFKSGTVKVELGLCKGKLGIDKREDMKRKDADRDAERAMRLAPRQGRRHDTER